MPAPILVDLKFNSETVARILKTAFADRGSINLADPANKGRDLTGSTMRFSGSRTPTCFDARPT
jgi:glyoxylate/hydroxypyruvate reductase A